MSNALSEQLAVISLDSFSQGGLGFYFLCRSCLVKGAISSIVWLREQSHPYR